MSQPLQDNLVSVVIPTYNSAVTLRRCIDSAISQDGVTCEVVVINDGSTDSTAEFAATYGQRIVFLEQENQGQGAARNAGLEVARGEFVAFLDADDYWLPGFLSCCLEFLRSHGETVAVNTGSIVKKWDKPDTLVPAFLSEEATEGESSVLLDNFFEFWGKHDHIRTGSSVIRRRVIDEAGFQQASLRMSQDLEYWGYIATFGTWGFIPKPYFVTDGTPAAAAQGWRAKYQTRRRLCPTVEQWESRIVPRLTDRDWPGFRIVRGRVASGYAHAKILAGDDRDALDIVNKYGSDFDSSRVNRAMLAGAKLGRVGWRLSCHVIRARESVKSYLIRATTRPNKNREQVPASAS